MLSKEPAGWDVRPTLSQEEFEAILADESKRIVGDLAWRRLATRLPSFRVDAPVASDAGWPLRISGWYRPDEHRLSFTLLCDDQRIAGLDFGRNLSHTNADGDRLRGSHLHFWSEEESTPPAFSIARITAPADQPLLVWRQFCALLRIMHQGQMMPPGARE